MKTKKETAKKTKVTTKKKAVPTGRQVASKVRTKAAVKKVIKKIKTAAPPKRAVKKHRTIAASIFSRKRPAIISKLIEIGRTEITFNPKRVTYMLLALALGILIAGFVLGFLEMIYLKNSLKFGMIPLTHQFLGMQLFLLPAVYVLIFGAGVVFGTWLGFWGWRVVYIEHHHRIFRNK